MNWKDKAYGKASELSSAGMTVKEWPKWLWFKIRLMNFIWDWFSWDAVKSGWEMPRMQFKMWKFYIKHPELKKARKEMGY